MSPGNDFIMNMKKQEDEAEHEIMKKTNIIPGYLF